MRGLAACAANLAFTAVPRPAAFRSTLDPVLRKEVTGVDWKAFALLGAIATYLFITPGGCGRRARGGPGAPRVRSVPRRGGGGGPRGGGPGGGGRPGGVSRKGSWLQLEG